MRLFKAVTIFTLAMLALSVGPLFAQTSPITVNVDRDSITTDDTLTLTVVISNAGGTPLPTLPPLDGFIQVGRSTTSSIRIVNGEVSAEATFEYRLQPIQTGTLTIGSVGVTLNGLSFSTDPIEVEVTQGTGQLQSAPPTNRRVQRPSELTDQEVFVEAEVDNAAPYLGEQVTYIFRHYRTIGTTRLSLIGQGRFELPPFSGFWNREQPQNARYLDEVDGREYRVLEVRKILFPAYSGTVTIDSTRLTVSGGILDPDTVLDTEPVTLEVRPLPEDAPPGFSGAVGRFQISARLDPAEAQADVPTTLTATVSGEGNVEALPEPVWPDMPGWRAFDSTVTISTDLSDGVLTGSRSYERLMVPGAAGDFTVPPIEYTYFDLEAAEYRTVETAPIPVSVAPATGQPSAGAGGGSKRPLELLATDIRHIKPVPSSLETARRPLTSLAGYWLAWGLFLGLFGATVLRQRRRRRLEADSALGRSLRAYRTASIALDRARAGEADPYAAIGQVLSAYISDKLNQPVAGLTHGALAGLLESRQVEADLVERVTSSLVAGEGGRFAPGGQLAGADALLDEARAVISELEKRFET